MPLYWIQDNIPALRGLSDAEKTAAKKRVLPKVYRHWQVWIPTTCVCTGIIAFLFLAPPFEGRRMFLFATAFIMGRLTYLPFNSLLQFHLEQERNSKQAVVTTAESQ